MVTGKAINLRVRPVQSADLSFPVSGIVARLPDTLLGQTVEAVNLKEFYATLSQTQGEFHGDPNGDQSLLIWTSGNIYTRLFSLSRILCELRAEPIKADLDNAIGLRQNAFITNYSEEVLAWAERVYVNNPIGIQNQAVWNQLSALLEDLFVNWSTLNQEYINDGLVGNVVKRPRSDTTLQSIQTILGEENRTNTASSVTLSGGYEYKMPSVENDIRYHRAAANVAQELLEAVRMREKCKNPRTFFLNELAAIDRQIKKLQVAYIDTMLLAPFPGLVTGVFCNEGDFVIAGQPIIRIENDASVYLVGTIKYRGLLRINYQVSVTTTLFDAEGGSQTKIDGVIASVRGHDSVDEQWDVLIRCVNRTDSGVPILPLNYNFDFESTTLEVTAV